MSVLRPLWMTRRRALFAGFVGLGAASGRVGAQATAAADPTPWVARAVPAVEPMWHLHVGGPSGLLGTGASGSLWALSLKGQAPRRLAEGIDTSTPIATGHGRIAARKADGGLWVWEEAGGAGRVHTVPPSRSANLSVHAGLLILPLAVLAVVTASAQPADPLGHRLARFEPDAEGHWREVARSKNTVLPDARPVQVDLDGLGDGGHIAVLAGPDGSRYDHGVLGDAIEATRMLWLERHGLDPLRELSLPAPHVFEDIAPRPVLLPGAQPGRGLLTVRSGPDGGQLALVTADPARPQGLRLAALGDTVGGYHRWLAPTTDGRHLAAVHTPHIGGVLHVYQPDGERLTRRRLHADVSTHRIGTREIDLAAWLQGLLILPSQDGRQLRLLNPAADWTELKAVTLPGRAILTAAVPDAPALAVLLEGGQVVLVGPSARAGLHG
ncbi:hypothetical protein BurJ1DRAFT_3224 [Burkholderiales bacterium JOSHI_001]|nr:hypothetical protein BurJ1DRAFT_3224 [Burkholderiales bacterium JOSHI_001]